MGLFFSSRDPTELLGVDPNTRRVYSEVRHTTVDGASSQGKVVQIAASFSMYITIINVVYLVTQVTLII